VAAHLGHTEEELFPENQSVTENSVEVKVENGQPHYAAHTTVSDMKTKAQQQQPQS
jgi:hypothetical protein